MHRNTFILTIALTIIAALIIGVNLTKPKSAIPAQIQADQSQDTVTPTVSASETQTLQTYTNDTCGIQFQYPSSINKLENAGGAVFSDPESSASAVIVTCQKEIPRVPLPKAKIESIKIGTFSASLYHDASPKDGTPIDKVIFTHPRLGLDVYIAGTGALFQSIIQSLNLL